MWLYFITVLAAALVLVALSLYFADLDRGITAFILAGVASAPYVILGFSFLYMYIRERKKIKEQAVYTYLIDDKIHITLKRGAGGQEEAQTELDWRQIYRAEETKNYILMFLNKFDAFVLDKQNTEQNANKELSDLMRLYLGKKFKN